METGALMDVAARLERAESPIHDQSAIRGLVALEESIAKAEAAWSGSWLGYHSRVYYKGLNPPPATARFSHEWGLLEGDGVHGKVSSGDWRKGRVEDVIAIIWKNAGHPNISALRQESAVAAQIFEAAKHEILSHLKSLLADRAEDDALARMAAKIRQSSIIGSQGFIEKWMPQELPFSRDSFAVGEGVQVPPHITVKAEVWAIRQPFTACGELAKSVRRLLSQQSHSGSADKPRLSSVIPRVITVHPHPPGQPRNSRESEATTDLPPPPVERPPVSLEAVGKPEEAAIIEETVGIEAAETNQPGVAVKSEDVPTAVASSPAPVARPLGMRAPPPSSRETPESAPANLPRTASPMAARAVGMKPPESSAPAAGTTATATAGEESARTGICLCHGRANHWKDLRDVLRKELPRDYHEFNLVPFAGVSSRDKVDELCRACGFAVLVLTEEDMRLQDERYMETQAIHAAGIFQGRLGYGRVVLLMEEGCEALVHLYDLPQITYAKGEIKSVLGQIKSILEKEGLFS